MAHRRYEEAQAVSGNAMQHMSTLSAEERHEWQTSRYIRKLSSKDTEGKRIRALLAAGRARVAGTAGQQAAEPCEGAQRDAAQSAVAQRAVEQRAAERHEKGQDAPGQFEGARRAPTPHGHKKWAAARRGDKRGYGRLARDVDQAEEAEMRRLEHG